MRMQILQDSSEFISQYPIFLGQLEGLRWASEAIMPLSIIIGGVNTIFADPGQHLRIGMEETGGIVGGSIGGFGGVIVGTGVGGMPVGAAIGGIIGGATGGAIGKEVMDDVYDKFFSDDLRSGPK